jgi:phosphoglycolate phosphatase-like HAD superfamily hydrolase
MKSVRTIVLFDIDYTLFNTKFFKESNLTKHKIYDEVAGVLDEIREIGDLGIFSKGETKFQKEKLKKTGISKFFKKDNIHIFEDKDNNIVDVIDSYKNYRIFLIDDKLSILHMAKKHNNSVFVIWVKRGPFAKTQGSILGFSPDARVENLSEIVKIIKDS